MNSDPLDGADTNMSVELLTELRAIGQADSEGTFTVDVSQAREKLASSRLASPAHWVLPMLAHSVCSGASRLAFEFSAESGRATHDGRSLTVDELNALPVFGLHDDSRALNHLRVAVDAVRTLFKEVSVTSGGHTMRWHTHGHELVEQMASTPGLSVRMSSPVWLGKLGGVTPTLAAWIVQLTEEPGNQERHILRSGACARVPLQVTVNGTPPFRHRRVTEFEPGCESSVLLTRAYRDPTLARGRALGVAWNAGFDADYRVSTPWGSLEYVVDGLSFVENDPRSQALEQFSISCVAFDPPLNIDLSYNCIIKDDMWESVMNHVIDPLDEIVIALADHFANVDESKMREFSLSQPVLAVLARLKAMVEDAATDEETAHHLVGTLVLLYSRIVLANPQDVDRVASQHAPFIHHLLSKRAHELPDALLERVAAAAWHTLGLYDRSMTIGALHQTAARCLSGRENSTARIRVLHHEVCRCAAQEESIGALEAAREAASFATSAERATALEVEALALRFAGMPDDGVLRHQEALEIRRTRGEEDSRAHVLLAEARWAAHNPAAPLTPPLEPGEAFDVRNWTRIDVAHLWMWLAQWNWWNGDTMKAYDCYIRSFRTSDLEDDTAQTHRATTFGYLRALVLRKGGFSFRLRDMLTYIPPAGVFSANALFNQQLWLNDYFSAADAEASAGLFTERLTTAQRGIERGQGYSSAWRATMRNLMLVHRLEGQHAQADRLLARMRLIMRYWPMRETGLFYAAPEISRAAASP